MGDWILGDPGFYTNIVKCCRANQVERYVYLNLEIFVDRLW